MATVAERVTALEKQVTVLEKQVTTLDERVTALEEVIKRFFVDTGQPGQPKITDI